MRAASAMGARFHASVSVGSVEQIELRSILTDELLNVMAQVWFDTLLVAKATEADL